MTKAESRNERSQRITSQLREKYPHANTYDLDGRRRHFVAEIEPVQDHPEYDRAVEVIIDTLPHMHIKATQHYKVISGTLQLHVGENTVSLNPDDIYIVTPGNIHWATSENECWVEILSRPGWTKEDHIVVDPLSIES